MSSSSQQHWGTSSYRGKNITKPPGGDASDIFGVKTENMSGSTTPRKNKDYQKSNIFSSDANANVIRNSPRHTPKTQDRLFGEDDNSAAKSPSHKVSNTFRSKIFNEDEEPPTTPYRTPKQPFNRNPITGEVVYAKQLNNEAATNGVVNGESNLDAVVNGDASTSTTPKKTRVPPGGHSQPLF